MELSTVYGPVQSWRFGRSLGIDAIKPPKKCTYSCIYCQLGRTVHYLRSPRDLKQPVTSEEVEAELRSYVTKLSTADIDFVTVSGCGEPTLNPMLKGIIEAVRRVLPGKRIVVLTNSSLMHLREVREALGEADITVAKLDAGDEKAYRLVNRPAPGMPGVRELASSIREARSMLKCLMLQVMLLETTWGFSNARPPHLDSLLDLILDISPDVVQLEVPYRPPAEPYVKVPPREDVLSAHKALVGYFGGDRVWTYGLHDERGKPVRWLAEASEHMVLELLARRPCTVQELAQSLSIPQDEVELTLKSLLERGLITYMESGGLVYYVVR